MPAPPDQRPKPRQVYITDELYDWVRNLAKSSNTTTSSIVRLAISRLKESSR